MSSRSWIGRIEFILLFGIATSVDMFYERLPTAAIRCLHGQKFDVECAEEAQESVFAASVGATDSSIRLGPALTQSLLERQKQHVQSVQAFTSALKV
jgi:origin recognition complex subunit 3